LDRLRQTIQTMSPIIASRATGPTTTPAMKALLFSFFGLGTGAVVMTATSGVVVVLVLVADGVFGDGEGVIGVLLVVVVGMTVTATGLVR